LKRVEITGTKGTVVLLEDSFSVWQFQDQTDRDREIREKFRKAKGTGGASDPAAIDYTGHKRNFGSFIEALESGEQFCLNGSEARRAVELVLAVYRSAESGQIVKL
jgi:predicted dehydrogenase